MADRRMGGIIVGLCNGWMFSHDLSRSLAVFDQNTSLIAVVELSEASWLVASLVPGVDRRPLKKLTPDPDALLRLLERWQAEAVRAGQTMGRVTLAYEAGRDGFWLARWLQARGIEVHVTHSTSVAVSREHRRAKTGLTQHRCWWRSHRPAAKPLSASTGKARNRGKIGLGEQPSMRTKG